jgi:hypothetical protein
MLLGILNSQAAGGGGGPAFDLLETTTLTTSASSVTFSGLGAYSDYKHLQVRMISKTTHSNTRLQLRFNSDTGSNYSNHYLRGSGGNVTSYGESSNNAIRIYVAAHSGSPASSFAAYLIDILDFSSAYKNTTTRTLDGVADGSGLQNMVQMESGLHQSTSAVTSATLEYAAGNFIAGSRFSLIGIK